MILSFSPALLVFVFFVLATLSVVSIAIDQDNRFIIICSPFQESYLINNHMGVWVWVCFRTALIGGSSKV